MQFKLTITISIFVFFFCIAAFIFTFGTYTQANVDIYHQLINHAKDNESSEYLSKQHRTGTQKDFLFYNKGQRLQMLLQSDTADLVFELHDKQINLIEEMDQVRCCVQEALYYTDNEPMQQILYLDTPKATYHYQNKLFKAEEVQISRYILKGHELPTSFEKPEKTLISGKAKHVEFSFKDNQFTFNADDFNAVFQNMGNHK